jgi:hypothetical protein
MHFCCHLANSKAKAWHCHGIAMSASGDFYFIFRLQASHVGEENRAYFQQVQPLHACIHTYMYVHSNKHRLKCVRQAMFQSIKDQFLQAIFDVIFQIIHFSVSSNSVYIHTFYFTLHTWIPNMQTPTCRPS